MQLLLPIYRKQHISAMSLGATRDDSSWSLNTFKSAFAPVEHDHRGHSLRRLRTTWVSERPRSNQTEVFRGSQPRALKRNSQKRKDLKEAPSGFSAPFIGGIDLEPFQCTLAGAARLKLCQTWMRSCAASHSAFSGDGMPIHCNK